MTRLNYWLLIVAVFSCTHPAVNDYEGHWISDHLNFFILDRDQICLGYAYGTPRDTFHFTMRGDSVCIADAGIYGDPLNNSSLVFMMNRINDAKIEVASTFSDRFFGMGGSTIYSRASAILTNSSWDSLVVHKYSRATQSDEGLLEYMTFTSEGLLTVQSMIADVPSGLVDLRSAFTLDWDVIENQISTIHPQWFKLAPDDEVTHGFLMVLTLYRTGDTQEFRGIEIPQVLRELNDLVCCGYKSLTY